MQILKITILSVLLKAFPILLLLYGLCQKTNAQQVIRVDIDVLEPASRTDRRINLSTSEDENYLPLTIIKGAKKGPVFTVLAGIHGFEYPPVIAVQELLKNIKPENLTGTLIILPMANPQAFYGRTVFNNPQDYKNLNRVFPGRADGTASERIADFITRQIIPMTDVFLDLHGGDANEDLMPFVCYYENKLNPEECSRAAALCLASGFPNVVMYPYNLKRGDKAEYAFKQAAQEGKVALSIEAGKLGQAAEEDITLTVEGVYRMLAKMGMYHNPQYNPTTKAPSIFTKQAYIKSPAAGILYTTYKSGDEVKKGVLLGHITDEFGKSISDLISLNDGIILYKIGTPPVNKGETLFCIAEK
jgi:predicted deacylase